jgi:hypothetical protein
LPLTLRALPDEDACQQVRGHRKHPLCVNGSGALSSKLDAGPSRQLVKLRTRRRATRACPFARVGSRPSWRHCALMSAREFPCDRRHEPLGPSHLVPPPSRPHRCRHLTPAHKYLPGGHMRLGSEAAPREPRSPSRRSPAQRHAAACQGLLVAFETQRQSRRRERREF